MAKINTVAGQMRATNFRWVICGLLFLSEFFQNK